jgi:hypothetical protein
MRRSVTVLEPAEHTTTGEGAFQSGGQVRIIDQSGEQLHVPIAIA